MILDKYVIDASMSEKWPWCYCPVEIDSDGNITDVVTGMNYIGFIDGELVGVFHPDGEEAANEWVKNNGDWKTRHSEGKTFFRKL